MVETDDALLERCLERFPELGAANLCHMLSLFRSVVAHAEVAKLATSHELEASRVEAAAVFDRVDVDGNGEVAFEELSASLQVCVRARVRAAGERAGLSGTACPAHLRARTPLTRTRGPTESHFLHGKGGGSHFSGHGR